MNLRTLLAGLVGGLAMFLWMFIAHMVLPLGEAGVTEMANEPPVLSAMQASLGNQAAVYVFPGSGLPANATSDQKNAAMKDYGKKLAAAPSGFLVYHGPGETFSFPKLLGVEFVLEVVESLLAAWLVSLTVLTGLIRRAAFVTGIGVVAAITTNVSYWNWYGFPTNYTAAYVFTQTIGFLCAGLVIAAMTRASAAARRGAAA